MFLSQHQYLTEALHWRAQTDPDHVLFVLLNAKVRAFPPPPPATTVLLSSLTCLWLVFQGAAVSTATCVQLHKRAEKIAAALTEKGSINTGENVVLLYPPSETPPPLSLLSSCSVTFSDFLFFSSRPTFVCRLLPRHRSDRRLLRLPVRGMRPRERQTPAPSEPSCHPAHRPHDY